MIPLEIEVKWLPAEMNCKNPTMPAGRKIKNLSIIARRIQIPKATKNETIWFFVIEEAKIPIAEKQAPKKIAPRYPQKSGPKSTSPKTLAVIA